MRQGLSVFGQIPVLKTKLRANKANILRRRCQLDLRLVARTAPADSCFLSRRYIAASRHRTRDTLVCKFWLAGFNQIQSNLHPNPLDGLLRRRPAVDLCSATSIGHFTNCRCSAASINSSNRRPRSFFTIVTYSVRGAMPAR
jgi:hypothetical protein